MITFKPDGTLTSRSLREIDENNVDGDVNIFKDLALAVPRGIEGAVQGIYGLADFVTFDALPDYDERFLGRSETIAGGFVEGAANFMTGFVPIAGQLGKVGQTGRLAVALKAAKGTRKAKDLKRAYRRSKFLSDVGAGAITDFTVFDAHEERLSDFIQNTALANPVSEFLAADKNDNELVGRLKNTIEGLFLEAGFAPLGKAFTATLDRLKAGKELREGQAPEEEMLKAFRSIMQGDVDFDQTIELDNAFDKFVKETFGSVYDNPRWSDEEAELFGNVPDLNPTVYDMASMWLETDASKSDPFAPMLREILANSEQTLRDTEFGALSLKDIEEGTRGDFDPETQTVRLPATTNTAASANRDTFLHEIVHAATVKKIAQTLGEFDRSFFKKDSNIVSGDRYLDYLKELETRRAKLEKADPTARLIDAYLDAVTQGRGLAGFKDNADLIDTIKRRSNRGELTYGYANIFEFASEFLSNRNFARQVGLEGRGRSEKWYVRIMEALRDLLGISTQYRGAFNDALSGIQGIIRETEADFTPTDRRFKNRSLEIQASKSFEDDIFNNRTRLEGLDEEDLARLDLMELERSMTDVTSTNRAFSEERAAWQSVSEEAADRQVELFDEDGVEFAPDGSELLADEGAKLTEDLAARDVLEDPETGKFLDRFPAEKRADAVKYLIRERILEKEGFPKDITEESIRLDEPSEKEFNRQLSELASRQGDTPTKFGGLDSNTPLYHGTPSGTFQKFAEGGGRVPEEQGVFFTTSKDFAKRFAEDEAKARGGTPRVVEARAKLKNPYVLDETSPEIKKEYEARLQAEREAGKKMSATEIYEWYMPDIQYWAQANDHDGIVVRGDSDTFVNVYDTNAIDMGAKPPADPFRDQLREWARTLPKDQVAKLRSVIKDNFEKRVTRDVSTVKAGKKAAKELAEGSGATRDEALKKMIYDTRVMEEILHRDYFRGVTGLLGDAFGGKLPKVYDYILNAETTKDGVPVSDALRRKALLKQLYKDLKEIKNRPSEDKKLRDNIDISKANKSGAYFKKDVEKFSITNKLIARGSSLSSSKAYADAVGNKANTGVYERSDMVGISAEGARSGRIKPDFNEIDKAIEAKVTFITDASIDRNRKYNVGEREVADYLTKKGYVDVGDGTWRPKGDEELPNDPSWKDNPSLLSEVLNKTLTLVDALQEQQDIRLNAGWRATWVEGQSTRPSTKRPEALSKKALEDIRIRKNKSRYALDYGRELDMKELTSSRMAFEKSISSLEESIKEAKKLNNTKEVARLEKQLDSFKKEAKIAENRSYIKKAFDTRIDALEAYLKDSRELNNTIKVMRLEKELDLVRKEAKFFAEQGYEIDRVKKYKKTGVRTDQPVMIAKLYSGESDELFINPKNQGSEELSEKVYNYFSDKFSDGSHLQRGFVTDLAYAVAEGRVSETLDDFIAASSITGTIKHRPADEFGDVADYNFEPRRGDESLPILFDSPQDPEAIQFKREMLEEIASLQEPKPSMFLGETDDLFFNPDRPPREPLVILEGERIMGTKALDNALDNIGSSMGLSVFLRTVVDDLRQALPEQKDTFSDLKVTTPSIVAALGGSNDAFMSAYETMLKRGDSLNEIRLEQAAVFRVMSALDTKIRSKAKELQAKGAENVTASQKAEFLEATDRLYELGRIWNLYGNQLGRSLVQRKALMKGNQKALTSGILPSVEQILNKSPMNNKEIGVQGPRDTRGVSSYVNQKGVESDQAFADRVNDFANATSTEEVAKIAKGMHGSKLMDIVLEYWTNSLLSGPTTQVVNIVGNGALFALRLLETTFGAALTANPALVRASLGAAFSFEGFGEALKLAVKAGRTGDNILTQGSKAFDDGYISQPKITAKNIGEQMGNLAGLSQPVSVESLGAWGSAINFLGKAVRLPSSLLQGGDEFFKQINYRYMAKTMLSYDAIVNKNLRGAGLKQYLAESYSKILQQGRAYNQENLDLNWYNANIRPKLESGQITAEEARKLDSDYRKGKLQDKEGKILERAKVEEGLNAHAEAALKFARENTFTEDLDPDTMLGAMGNAINNLKRNDATRFISFIVPFVRTPTNIIKTAIDRTPAGVEYRRLAGDTGRLFLSKLTGKQAQLKSAILSKDPVTRANAAGQIATGTMFASAAFYYALNSSTLGLITGGGPADADRRRALQMSGWQPYSIKIGDKYWSYNKLDPISSVIGIYVDMVEAFRYHEVDDGVLESAFSVVAMSAVNNIANKSFLQGMSNVLDVLKDPLGATERAAGDVFAGFVPTFFQQAMNFQQVRELKEARGFVDRIIKRSPFSDKLMPKRNALGEKIMVENTPLGPLVPSYIRSISDDPVDQEIARLNKGFSIPKPKIMNTFDMRKFVNEDGQTAYDRFQQEAGNVKINGLTLREALNRFISSPTYKRLPAVTYADLELGVQPPQVKALQKIINRYRRVGKIKMFEDFPELQDEINNLLQKRSNIRNGIQ